MASGLFRVALTGGIATGKSHCLRRFAAAGLPTIDADVLARDAVEPGTPGLAAVVARFGPAVLAADGTLDRAALGRIVFADATARRALEQVVHPFVYEAIEAWFTGLDRQSTASGRVVAVADIPLLYETGDHDRFDAVVVAACREDLQLARLMARDALARDEAARRIRTQLPIADKRARADYVIDTSDTIDETNRQIAALVESLREAASKRPPTGRR